jgi:AcrR family transcriptional regulator
MPRVQRKAEEIAAVKDQIQAEAMALIVEQGFRGLSMRRLATRLGIAAKTIYNYYRNKDELYLVILTRGFEELHAELLSAYQSQEEPLERLTAMARAYLEFGLERSHLYNLMFTWHVPKFKDYLGTSMQGAAQLELEAGLKNLSLLVKVIKECADPTDPVSEEEARYFLIQLWSQMHGYVAGINNTLLEYMHEAPLSLKERLLDDLITNFGGMLAIRSGRQGE